MKILLEKKTIAKIGKQICCKNILEICVSFDFQVIDTFLREILGKLVTILKSSNFQSYNTECPSISDNSLATSPDTAKPSILNQFESQLIEMIATAPIIKQYQNISYRYEYYLNVGVFGRDGNDQRLVADESPVLIDLANIDNFEFSLFGNVTLNAPRRFFRLGVTEVSASHRILWCFFVAKFK